VTGLRRGLRGMAFAFSFTFTGCHTVSFPGPPGGS
jgi:hypothetical protein